MYQVGRSAYTLLSNTDSQKHRFVGNLAQIIATIGIEIAAIAAAVAGKAVDVPGFDVGNVASILTCLEDLFSAKYGH